MANFSQKSFEIAVGETLNGINICLEQGLFVPTQILIFSAIDAFSFIELRHIADQKKRFEAWVNLRLLPHDEVLCDAVDLYAARSAVIHRLGVQSRLSESGKAGTIAYSRGTASFKTLLDLRDSVRANTGKTIPIVRLEALSDALTKGISCFLQEIETNPALGKQMEVYWEREQPVRFPTQLDNE